MGNICGCVRGPKEECYVDPKKAPLSPGSKELKGRRYFQRKKRKSEDLKANGSLRSSPGEVISSSAVCNSSEIQDDSENNSKQNQKELNEFSQVGNQLTRQGSLSKGVYIGEVPVTVLRSDGNPSLGTRLACRLESLSTDLEDDHKCGTAVERKLHGVSTTSRSVSAKDGLLVKKLLQYQLRRAVSFGEVEHMLWTLNGNDKLGSEAVFAKIVCGSQAHRRRRHGSFTCCGYIEPVPVPAEFVSTRPK
ncbi:hypothetical protein XENOCAPTIV_024175, partial [Xenoophorus captivus]